MILQKPNNAENVVASLSNQMPPLKFSLEYSKRSGPELLGCFEKASKFVKIPAFLELYVRPLGAEAAAGVRQVATGLADKKIQAGFV